MKNESTDRVVAKLCEEVVHVLVENGYLPKSVLEQN
jgi:hypothetical protein